MNVAALVLEYLKVLLSAPVVAGAVTVVFMHLFRPQIGGLIDRAWRIKFPGGELSASQQEKTRDELAPATGAPDQLAAGDVTLPNTIQVTPEQAQQVVQLVRSERANAALWEYRYLNFFLVRSTQLVLDWLAAQQQPVSLRLLDSYWQPLIPSANERAAIVSALETHHLVTTAADAANVSPKGREYLQWRGPLPPAIGRVSI